MYLIYLQNLPSTNIFEICLFISVVQFFLSSNCLSIFWQINYSCLQSLVQSKTSLTLAGFMITSDLKYRLWLGSLWMLKIQTASKYQFIVENNWEQILAKLKINFWVNNHCFRIEPNPSIAFLSVYLMYEMEKKPC